MAFKVRAKPDLAEGTLLTNKAAIVFDVEQKIDTNEVFNTIGNEPVTVLNVVGQARAAAETAITSAGLTLGSVTEAYSDTVTSGNVISQNPAAGASVAPGTAIALVVSKGVEPVTVPNVVGQARAAAEGAITGADLTVGVVTEAYSDTVVSGNVISQNPAAGASVAPGTAVALVVSKGKEPSSSGCSGGSIDNAKSQFLSGGNRADLMVISLVSVGFLFGRRARFIHPARPPCLTETLR